MRQSKTILPKLKGLLLFGCIRLAISFTTTELCVYKNRIRSTELITDPHLSRNKLPSVVRFSSLKRNASLGRVDESIATSSKVVRKLSVVPLGADVDSNKNFMDKLKANVRSVIKEDELNDVFPVLTAILLITGNTVGAGIIAMPSLAVGPGMSITTLIIFGVYLINLLSGLLIAEVAIKQKEAGSKISSSFKEFTEINLKSKLAGTFIGLVSVFNNWCVLAFDLVSLGEMISRHLPLLSVGNGIAFSNTNSASGIASIALILFATTQSNMMISRIASICVLILFIAFSGLVIPGLSHIHDPIQTFLHSGESMAMTNGVANAIPIFMMAMVYQNIVPSITKLLDFDRTKCITAIVIGSFVPAILYITYCFVATSEHVNQSYSTNGLILTIFSLATLMGSSTGCVLSLAEEFESLLHFPNESSKSLISKVKSQETVFSIQSVVFSVVPPLAVGWFYCSCKSSDGSNCFTAALSAAGGYSSPLLYGIVPVLLALTQRGGSESKGYGTSVVFKNSNKGNLVPGGSLSLGFLGGISIIFLTNQLYTDVSSLARSVPDAM